MLAGVLRAAAEVPEDLLKSHSASLNFRFPFEHASIFAIGVFWGWSDTYPRHEQHCHTSECLPNSFPLKAEICVSKVVSVSASSHQPSRVCSSTALYIAMVSAGAQPRVS